jgi:hypothetical protein
MKNLKTLLLVAALAIGIAGCKKNKNIEKTEPQLIVAVPTLSTASITNITNSTAQSGGSIINDNNAEIINKGIVWNTMPSPTISLATKTLNGAGKEAFTSEITGLISNTKYYVRAYATNSVGTAYGEEYSFTTNIKIGLPTLTTWSITAITNSTAQSGGYNIVNNNATITTKGIVWSTMPSPSISLGTNTFDGLGNDEFTSKIAGLLPNTKYYVRAYAISNAGTAYGNELSFTTAPSVNLSLNLDGKWLTSGGNGITISGSNAVLYSFSTSWQTPANMGLISIGTITLKNIVKTSTYKWSCLDLNIYRENSIPKRTIWSYNGTITMSQDGKTITVNSDTIMPDDGRTQNVSTVYSRQ